MVNVFQKFKNLFHPIDLTKGKIGTSLFLFLIPIVLSQIFQQIYSLTDSIIIGQNLNANQVAGINDAVPLAFLVLGFVQGTTAGFSVILSRAFGAKDFSLARKSVFVQIILSIIFVFILTIASFFLIDFLLSFLKLTPSQSDPNMNEIYQAAKMYLTIIFLGGVVSQMFYNMISSILRALGDSFVPFLFLVLSTLLNIGLDLLFIVVFSWGIEGSAIATVISQSLAAIGAFIYAFTRYPQIRFQKEDTKVSFSFVWEHIRLGVPLGLQYSITYIGVIVMQAAVIPFDILPDGTSVVSNNPFQVGYGVSNKLGGLMMVFMSSLGTGMLSFISQNFGAKEYKRIQRGFRLSLIAMTLICILLMTITLLLTINGSYQYLFLSKDNITEGSILTGNTYLYICVPFYIPLGYIYLTRNVIQGLEKPFYPLIGGFAELIIRVVVCGFLPQILNGGPINSEASFSAYALICWADPITWVVSALIVFLPSVVYIRRLNSKTITNLSKIDS
ncbi:MAG: polysaccharide biosynthesis C-terminal domain-containing protein [Bacilli bacterium]|nr:polysaccharide biosynthesis C-terminal domain-containing protein [Bacilli bacterium]